MKNKHDWIVYILEDVKRYAHAEGLKETADNIECVLKAQELVVATNRCDEQDNITLFRGVKDPSRTKLN